MKVGKFVLNALKVVGKWGLENHDVALDAVDKVAKIQAGKKVASNEEHLQIVDEKLNQLGAATLELDQKIDFEAAQVRTELKTMRKQMRTMKIIRLVMGAALGVAVILLAVF